VTNRQLSVRILENFHYFKVLSGVPQGSELCPLLFNIFINDLCKVIEHSNVLLFTEDVKIFRAKNSVDCIQLQSDISRTQGWCFVDYVKLNTSKTRVTTCTRKTHVIYYKYKINDWFITCTHSVQGLRVQLDSKLHFRAYVNYIFSQSVRTLGLIRTVTYSFSTLDNLLILYLTPGRPNVSMPQMRRTL
jgi:hypothetical protein